MMRLHFINSLLCASLLLVTPIMANAELFDRGEGLIYDSDQNLTWMQNADVNGKISVHQAMSWAENLVYAGYDDWRLPTTTQFDDPSCLEDVRSDLTYGSIVFFERHANCLYGEMERLTASADPYTNPIFENVRNLRYWTSTPYRDGIDPCTIGGFCVKSPDNGKRVGFYWQWDFQRSVKATLSGGALRYAWAVRNGFPASGKTVVVELYYLTVFDRVPDQAGFDYYVERLITKDKISSSELALDLFLSPEFTQRNLSNEEFIATAYVALLGRAPEAAGAVYWLQRLEEGISRQNVLIEIMLGSSEFTEYSASLGVRAF